MDSKKRDKVFYIQELSKRFPKLHHKMWVSIAYCYLEYSKISHNIYKEQLYCLTCNQCLIHHLKNNGNCVFYEVSSISESFFTSIRDLLQEGFGLSSSPRLRGRGAGRNMIPPKAR